MPGSSLVFRSARAEFEVPTRFGGTHVILSGLASAPPAILLPGNFASATMWHSCVAKLSRGCRTYAVDTVGDLGKSVATRLGGLSASFPTPTRVIDMSPQTSHTEAVAVVVRE